MAVAAVLNVGNQLRDSIAVQIDNVILGFKPLFVEYIPLTLEEIFIAEMEERGYEFHESYIG